MRSRPAVSSARCWIIRSFHSSTLISQLRAATNHRRLRALGVTIRKTVDLVIGTFCIERGHTLLHADRDFEPMQRHLGLMTA